MTASNAMNSLPTQRFVHESQAKDYTASRNAAFNTVLNPQTNAFLAVGLVSLQGLMTGQILAGVDPISAARDQIVVLCLIFGTPGIAAAIYRALNQWQLRPDAQENT